MGGVRSLVAIAGDPSDPNAVVFVHGNPGPANDWADLMKQVAPFSRALAPDLPGYGQAGKPASLDYSVDGYAKHLGALLDEHRVERAHLVLHDSGGPSGLAWACARVDRVASITLLNIGIMPGYRWRYMARIWRLPVIGELSMLATSRAGMRMALRHGNPRGLPRAYLDELYDNHAWGTRRAILKLYRHAADPGSLSDRLAAAPSRHRLPVLVVWGECDPYVSAEYAETQRQFFEVKRLVRLKGSGHWPMIDHPTTAADAVVPFVRTQCLGSPADDRPNA